MFLVACQAEKPAPQLKISLGQTMPNFSAAVLKQLDDKPASLQFSSGKITILNIWATWCGPCRHEMPSLQRLSSMLDPKRFQVIGISVDTDIHVARVYLIDKKISFSNYINPDMSIANDNIGIRVYPTTFIIDAQAYVQHIEEGWRFWDEPDIVKVINDIALKK